MQKHSIPPDKEKMALVPDGKTEWLGLGSLGEEKGAVVATPAKTIFFFS